MSTGYAEKLATLLEECLAKQHGREPRPVTAESLGRMGKLADRLRDITRGANKQ